MYISRNDRRRAYYRIYLRVIIVINRAYGSTKRTKREVDTNNEIPPNVADDVFLTRNVRSYRIFVYTIRVSFP